MSTTEKPLKIELAGQIRRFQLPITKEPYAYVKNLINTHYPTLESSFELIYEDDEKSPITLSSEEEMVEALRLFATQKSIKLTITPVELTCNDDDELVNVTQQIRLQQKVEKVAEIAKNAQQAAENKEKENKILKEEKEKEEKRLREEKEKREKDEKEREEREKRAREEKEKRDKEEKEQKEREEKEKN